MNMKFRKKCIILLMILGILILGCGKKQKVINSKDYNEISEVDLVNENIKKEELENVMYPLGENPKLFKLYGNILSSYSLENFPDLFYNNYSENFLDKENNFVMPNEEKINLFLSDYNENQYKLYLEKNMKEMKDELSKKSQYKNKELDKKTEDFINSIEEKILVMGEIKNYYKNKEYQKDNFEKGKKLSEKYIKSYKDLIEKYDKFFHEFRRTMYIAMKNRISILELETDKKVSYNMLKINLLCEMFRDKFYGSKLYIDVSDPFIIEENDKEKYVNELKSIQKTLDNTISDMKKLNDSQLSGENISKEDFKNLLHKIEEISKETKSIIIKIETGKNDEVNKMIDEYSKKFYSLNKK